MERRRVAITGLGAVSPVGNTAQESWEAVRGGRGGVGAITLFDASDYPVQIAAEVKGFDLARYGIDRRLRRKTDRFTQFLLAASAQAVRDAGLDGDALAGNRTGVVAGNCLAGLDSINEAYTAFCSPAAGPFRMPMLTIPLMISNEAAANVSMLYGIQGPCQVLNTACASGTDALGTAAALIRSGRVDVCLGGGTEAPVTGFAVASISQLQAMTLTHNGSPAAASRPFDRDRDGFVLGEGAAVLVLEELEHARRRGARIYAELAGYGASCDAYHLTAPRTDGSGAALAMRAALEDAGMEPQDVQYYNAHGTSTGINDAAETNMLKLVFGAHAHSLRISSTKSMTGHMIGAAGAIEALFCVRAITDGFVPPTINLEHPDVEGGCDLDYTPLAGRPADIRAAASASLGFGGHNAAVIIRAYEP